MKHLIKVVNHQDLPRSERNNLFNKYQIPTSLTHYIPLDYLVDYILLQCSRNSNGDSFTSFGHAQLIAMNRRVKNTFNNSNEYIKIKTDTVHYMRFSGDKHVPFLSFYPDTTITFHGGNMASNRSTIRIPRDLYDKIDEWLVDFGYCKWTQN